MKRPAPKTNNWLPFLLLFLIILGIILAPLLAIVVWGLLEAFFLILLVIWWKTKQGGKQADEGSN